MQGSAPHVAGSELPHVEPDIDRPEFLERVPDRRAQGAGHAQPAPPITCGLVRGLGRFALVVLGAVADEDRRSVHAAVEVATLEQRVTHSRDSSVHLLRPPFPWRHRRGTACCAGVARQPVHRRRCRRSGPIRGGAGGPGDWTPRPLGGPAQRRLRNRRDVGLHALDRPLRDGRTDAAQLLDPGPLQHHGRKWWRKDAVEVKPRRSTPSKILYDTFRDARSTRNRSGFRCPL